MKRWLLFFFLTCISQQESARLVLKWMSEAVQSDLFCFFFQGVTFNSLGKEKESLFFQLLVSIFFSIVWQMSFFTSYQL